MLHMIAAGTRDVSQQQTPYLAQARDTGFVYQPGELCGLNRERRELQIAAVYADDGRLGFYPEITDCLERTENFWSCLTRRRRILGLWRRSIYSNTSDRAASSVGYVVR